MEEGEEGRREEAEKGRREIYCNSLDSTVNSVIPPTLRNKNVSLLPMWTGVRGGGCFAARGGAEGGAAISPPSSLFWI